MKTEDLSKMILIYNFLAQTEKPTKAVEQARRKLRRSISSIYTNQESLYLSAKEQQREAYVEAWNEMFGKNQETVVSMGTFIMNLWYSVENQKLVGKKVMEKAIDSYYFATTDYITEEEKLEAEINANGLSDRFLKLLGEETQSILKSRVSIIKNNLIIEGKI